jgi:hypothetical protein
MNAMALLVTARGILACVEADEAGRPWDERPGIGDEAVLSKRLGRGVLSAAVRTFDGRFRAAFRIPRFGHGGLKLRSVRSA